MLMLCEQLSPPPAILALIEKAVRPKAVSGGSEDNLPPRRLNVAR